MKKKKKKSPPLTSSLRKSCDLWDNPGISKHSGDRQMHIYLPKVITIYPMNNQVCSKYVLEVHCLIFLTLFPTEKMTKIFPNKVYRRLLRKSQDAKLCKTFNLSFLIFIMGMKISFLSLSQKSWKEILETVSLNRYKALT